MSTEAETLQELLTEAHGVIKDLRAQTRVTKLVIEELQAVVHAQVTRDMAAQIDAIVKEELADYHQTMMKAIAETEAAIQGRFDRIARIMLGETKTAIRQGETLEDSAAKIRQIIEDKGILMERVIYIAGPMYGLPEKNYPAFQAAEKLLLDAGHAVISPLEADRFVGKDDPEPSREWWQRTTMRLLLNANALALLPGWQGSKGAKLERYVADCLGYEIHMVEDWL